VTEPRTIIVMRHAKAEQSAPSDFERQLTDRGVADATAAGTWLASRGFVPDHALVSAAVRTQQTWDALVDGGGWDVDPDVDDALYDAGPESAMDLVRAVPDHVQTLLVVGHNPTMASLAQLLDDGEGDEDAGNEMATGFPTSAVAVFSFDGDWRELAEASASVVAFHVGRG
jgi:phosphohistidine phosphatase